LFSEKLAIQEKDESINTLIFGSSRMYRQVNPLLFDSLMLGDNIHSFNLATPATFVPESIHLLNAFIKSKNSEKIKYILYEMQTLGEIPEKKKSKIESYYWAHPNYLILALECIKISDWSKSKKLKSVYDQTINLIWKYVRLDKIKKLFENQDLKVQFIKTKGFEPLNIDNIKYNNYAKRVYDKFHSDTSEIIKYIDSSIKIETYQNYSKPKNYALCKSLSNLHTLAKQKNIQLFFVVPPRLTTGEYEQIMSCNCVLSPNSIIELANYNKYPQLYLAKNTFDIGHLNETGSELFTQYLANSLLDIIH
jgi:hypothetical protein